MSTAQRNKISIIMPVYNREAFIGASIQSILDQSYPDWELLVIDDGSTDTTIDKVKEKRDPRIKVFSKAHCGIVGRLRIYGLSQASGSFIAFHDSDDLWHPSKLQMQYEALLRYPEAGFCLTNGFNFRVQDQPLEYFYQQREGEETGSWFEAAFASKLACFLQALLIRKNCLSASGLFVEEGNSDREFILSLAHRFKGVVMYTPLVERRLHPQNFNTTKWKKSYAYEFDCLKRYRSQLPLSLYQSALYSTHMRFGQSCLEEGFKMEALQQFIKAWKIEPFSIRPLKKMVKALLS